MSIRRGSVRIDVTAKGNAGEVQKVLNEILESVDQGEEDTSTYSGVASNDEDALVRTLYAIERAANDVLGASPASTPGEPQRRGVFQLRQSLRDAGMWSDAELRKFDNVVRLRNAIVHGDNRTSRSTTLDSRAALADAEELLSSLKSKARQEK
jgi:uncharacterized protein YutE (UPF0331/DUF86 family)